jgi:hypothetical protein
MECHSTLTGINYWHVEQYGWIQKQHYDEEGKSIIQKCIAYDFIFISFSLTYINCTRVFHCDISIMHVRCFGQMHHPITPSYLLK